VAAVVEALELAGAVADLAAIAWVETVNNNKDAAIGSFMIDPDISREE